MGCAADRTLGLGWLVRAVYETRQSSGDRVRRTPQSWTRKIFARWAPPTSARGGSLTARSAPCAAGGRFIPGGLSLQVELLELVDREIRRPGPRCHVGEGWIHARRMIEGADDSRDSEIFPLLFGAETAQFDGRGVDLHSARSAFRRRALRDLQPHVPSAIFGDALRFLLFSPPPVRVEPRCSPPFRLGRRARSHPRLHLIVLRGSRRHRLAREAQDSPIRWPLICADSAGRADRRANRDRASIENPQKTMWGRGDRRAPVNAVPRRATAD